MATFGPWPAVVLSVYDGDTCTLVIDLGFNLTLKTNCRVYGIDAPELRTHEGDAARVYARQWLHTDDPVTVLSHGWDKYGGRIDATITLADGTDFATRMLEAGHAKPYKGGPR